MTIKRLRLWGKSRGYKWYVYSTTEILNQLITQAYYNSTRFNEDALVGKWNEFSKFRKQ